WRVDYTKTISLLATYAVIGLAIGIIAVVFQQLMSLFNVFLLEGITGYGDTRIVIGARRIQLPWLKPAVVRWWLFPVVAGVGGLVTGLLVHRFAPEAAGHGTDEVILAYHDKRQSTPLRVSFVKMIASAITLGSGGSGGKEGPIAQIGAGLASYAAGRFSYLHSYRHEIMLAGMAAGIAAVFRAPLAAPVFATEILYSRLRYEGRVLIPAVIASAASYGVYTRYFGVSPVFTVPDFNYFFSIFDLVSFTVLGIVSAGCAILFVRVFYGIRDVFASVSLPPYLKPAIGGLLTGSIAMAVPQVLGEGSYNLQLIISGGLPLLVLLAIGLLKMVATGLSIGSGGSGGVFGPSLFAGAALGGAFGMVHNLLIPTSGIPIVVFVLLGMVGFFSGAANAPLSTVIIVAEMTRTFSLLAPFLWVSMFGYLFSQKWDIYENQVPLTEGILASIRDGTEPPDDTPAPSLHQ
ncbi:MAG: chloride channel protein, partial [Alkalispirochaeta sp.]